MFVVWSCGTCYRPGDCQNEVPDRHCQPEHIRQTTTETLEDNPHVSHTKGNAENPGPKESRRTLGVSSGWFAIGKRGLEESLRGGCVIIPLSAVTGLLR